MGKQLADYFYPGPIKNPTGYGEESSALGSLLNNVFTAAAVGGGILLFAYLIFGGFKYITAGGDEKAVTAAKTMLTNAIIGMIIMAFAYFIVGIIGGVLGVDIFKLDFPGPGS